MATATCYLLLQTSPTRFLTPNQIHALPKRKHQLKLPLCSATLNPSFHQSIFFPPFLPPFAKKRSSTISCAYVTGPASDPNVSDSDHKLDQSEARSEKVQSPNPKLISWSLLWSLLLKHKLRLGISALTLVGCTTCTLSMPIFSGINNSY